MDSLKLISKLAGNKLDASLAALLVKQLTQPMLVQPQMIDTYVRGFLMGATLGQPTEMEDRYSSVPSYYLPEIKTGVLEISGAMTSRPVSVPCAQSPASYEKIKMKMEGFIDSFLISSMILFYITHWYFLH